MAKKKRSRSKRKALKSGRNRTPISGHRRNKGQLVTPINASEMGKSLQNSSWVDIRLPEMLCGCANYTCARKVTKGLNGFEASSLSLPNTNGKRI